MNHQKMEVIEKWFEKKEHPILEMMRTALITAVVVGVVSLFVRPVVVNGDSMNDTLHNGDKLMMVCRGYELTYDDIVVLYSNGYQKQLIKRVIGMGGDTIDIDFESGTVTRNGEVLDEPYIKELTYTDEGAFEYPVTVPENCLFVMGDNRNDSSDSRRPEIGFVTYEELKGKVIFRYSPINMFGDVY